MTEEIDLIEHVKHNIRGNPEIMKMIKNYKKEFSTSKEKTEWSTDELTHDFEVIGFSAPFVVVKRRSDGVKGSLQFDGRPRRYYDWKDHKS